MKDIIWENDIPKSKEEDELDKDLAEELEWIQLPDELEGILNKRTLEEIDEISVDTFATDTYGISPKKVYNENNDKPQVESAWDPKRSPAPI